MKWSHILKFHWGTKDGGTESRVWCYGVESKLFGSLLVLRFAYGSREAFHSHAFNALSWLITGRLHEVKASLAGGYCWSGGVTIHKPAWKPIHTTRETFHKVEGWAPNSWVLTLRGPWRATWSEFLPLVNRFVRLTHGRKEVTA